MSNLVSSLSKNVQAVPEEYILPKEERPGDIAAPVCKDIPVIDLSQAEGSLDRYEIIQTMMKASQEFGIFQVHPLSLLFGVRSFYYNNLIIRYKVMMNSTAIK